MTSFISNIIWNSVEGFVEAGKKTAGEYGGNALIKAGDMIENGGRSVGNGKPLSLSENAIIVKEITKPLSRHRAQSNELRHVHYRPNLQALGQSPTLDGT